MPGSLLFYITEVILKLNQTYSDQFHCTYKATFKAKVLNIHENRKRRVEDDFFWQ